MELLLQYCNDYYHVFKKIRIKPLGKAKEINLFYNRIRIIIIPDAGNLISLSRQKNYFLFC